MVHLSLALHCALIWETVEVKSQQKNSSKIKSNLIFTPFFFENLIFTPLNHVPNLLYCFNYY